MSTGSVGTGQAHEVAPPLSVKIHTDFLGWRRVSAETLGWFWRDGNVAFNVWLSHSSVNCGESKEKGSWRLTGTLLVNTSFIFSLC